MTQLCLCVSIYMSIWLSLRLPPPHREAPQSPMIALQVRCRSTVDANSVLTRRGQQCDPDGAQKFYGCSGEGLVCQRKTPKGVNRAEPEPSCVCQEKGPVFGSEGWTYPNVFQMRKAVAQTLKLNGRGPSTLVAVPFFFLHKLAIQER